MDTDDDVMGSANRACARDFKYADYKLKRLGWDKVTNNHDIRHRIAYPEYYDRTAKFMAHGLSFETAIHPSMDNLNMPKVA